MSIIQKYRNWRLRKHVEKFGSKNNGYFNYFNRKWFEEHQTTLIFLLNHWLLKFWFRWILRIHKDCKFDEVIDKIEPHAYRIKVGENTYRSDFRTHQKFSKRIYYAFRPYWYLLHALDFVIQRTINPDFSFGFDTLTTYPDSNIETSTVDGVVGRSSYPSDYQSVSQGAGNYADDNSTQNYMLEFGATINLDEFDTCYRSIFLFDTSVIGSDSIISDASMSINVWTHENGFTSLIDVLLTAVATNPYNNTYLINADYNRFAMSPLSDNISLNTMSNAYNVFTFNVSGKSLISKIGISKFGIVNTFDINYTYPDWVDSAVAYASCYYADYTGTSYDPKLVVTYTLPATGNKFQMVV